MKKLLATKNTSKEEWLKEYYRNEALTPEERDRERHEYIKSIKTKRDNINTQNVEVLRQTSADPFENCDHPNSLENNEATILWLGVMIVATIFKGNWAIWIIATIIWRRYITRHKRKK